MLKPAGTLSLKYILLIKDGGKIKKTRLPVMKGISNTKGAALCITFLLSGHCDYTDPYGYHLQVNDPNHLPVATNANYEPFHNWLVASKEYVCLSKAASQKFDLDPSSSS